MQNILWQSIQYLLRYLNLDQSCEPIYLQTLPSLELICWHSAVVFCFRSSVLQLFVPQVNVTAHTAYVTWHDIRYIQWILVFSGIYCLLLQDENRCWLEQSLWTIFTFALRTVQCKELVAFSYSRSNSNVPKEAVRQLIKKIILLL